MFSFQLFPWKKGPSKLEEACSRRQKAKSASRDNIQVSWCAKPKCIHLIWITWMLTCSISLHCNIQYLWCFHIIDCGGQEGENLNGRCVTKSTAVSPFPATVDSPLVKLNFLWAALWSPPPSFFCIKFLFLPYFMIKRCNYEWVTAKHGVMTPTLTGKPNLFHPVFQSQRENWASFCVCLFAMAAWFTLPLAFLKNSLGFWQHSLGSKLSLVPLQPPL